MATDPTIGGVGSTDLEYVSPSLVIPDHFSCSQSTTLVIVYDEPVGCEQDQVSFIFPGEVQSSPLKKVVPTRVGHRTFILETPVYSSSSRGFLYVTPQVRLAATGELKEMSDIKISLKHPVRSVMELCLKLSTQNAVLPVLLALMMHAKEADEEELDSEDYKLLQDAHFDRIMATLVGSIEPGTKYLREVLLPSRRWKKCSLEEFARIFKMQEMEKQAYMLRQRAKEKKRGKQTASNSYAQSEDDLDDPFYPLGQSQLSTSTPEIFRDVETESMSSVRDSRLMASGRRNVKTRTLPHLPTKAMSFREPSVSNSRTKNSEKDDYPNVYDPIDFDDPVPIKALSKKLMVRDPISSRADSQMSSSWAAPPIPHKKPLPEAPRRDDDVASLDSYEDMNNNDTNLAEDDTRFNKRAPKPLPLALPDPSTRPQLPLPPSSTEQVSPSHQYSVSLKMKKKRGSGGIGNRPLPPEPLPDTTYNERPQKNPKPAGLKQRKVKRGGVAQSFRKKDIYVPDSASSDDDEDANDRIQFTPGKPPVTMAKSCSENDISGANEEHLYEAPDKLNEVKKKKKKVKSKKDVPAAPRKPSGGLTNGRGHSLGGASNGNDGSHDQDEYENLAVLREVENEQDPDKPPPLPPAPNSRNPPGSLTRNNHSTPTAPFTPPPPSYPPPSDNNNCSSPDVPPHHPKPNKKALPMPPTKHKIPSTPKPQPHPVTGPKPQLPGVTGPKPARIKSNPTMPPTPPNAAADTMAQLSTAILNRSVGGGAPPPPLPKGSKSRKPVGGMRYI